MTIARVDEQLGVRDERGDLLGSVYVTLSREERVSVHAVDLHRNALRPWPEGPLAGDRHSGVDEDRSDGTGAALRQTLGLHHAEREPNEDEAGREVRGCGLRQCVEVRSVLGAGEGSTCLDGVEGPTTEE